MISNGPWALVFQLDLVGELCFQHFHCCECLDGQLVLHSHSVIFGLYYCFWSQLVSTVCVAVLMQCSHVHFHCHFYSLCGHPMLRSVPPSIPSTSPQNIFQTDVPCSVGCTNLHCWNRLLGIKDRSGYIGSESTYTLTHARIHKHTHMHIHALMHTRVCT